MFHNKNLSWLAGFAVATVVLLPAARAAITVDYMAGLGQRTLADKQNNTLADGNEVRIGFFVAGFDVAANGGDLLALDGAWTEYDATSVITLLGTQSGSFTGSMALNDLAMNFSGQRIHLWVLDTSDNLVPDGTYSNVDEWGIYTNLTDPAWVFPTEGVAPNFTSVSTDGVTDALVGSVGALSLQTIPEPTAPFLAVLAGGLACLRRRRTRQ